MLELKNLEVTYNQVVLAVRGVSMEVQEGTVCALLGANGAGKTTILRAISSVLTSQDGEVTDGTICLDGDPITDLAADKIVRRGICHVPEGRQVFRDLTVEENLRAAAFTLTDRRKVESRLEMVQEYFPKLTTLWKGKAGYLSGGEQQMLALGRGLMLDPRLLILDEPSLGLAPVMVDEITRIVTEVSRQERVTVLLVEQNAQIALDLSDYCYVLENGRIVLDGRSSEIAENQDIKEFYLGASEGSSTNYAAIKHYRRRKRWMS
ncbi:ABC transporter ATP-binding protein [Nocardioides sp. Root140]|nr:ABC transporter ATP-binding protein [Nocardioides sp. Root140]KRF17607.1 ABC transporter ATP-binding protein [Nocardioides sp. Soil796]